MEGSKMQDGRRDPDVTPIPDASYQLHTPTDNYRSLVLPILGPSSLFHAHHRAGCNKHALPLDFLAPALIQRRFKATHIKPLRVKKKWNVAGNAFKPLHPAFSQPAAQPDAATATGSSARLPAVHVNEEPVTERLNSQFLSLDKALRTRNLDVARATWRDFDRESLNLLASHQIDIISRHVASIFEQGLIGPENDADRQLLEDIAIFAAANHSTEGLKRCMIAALRRGDVEGTLALYQRFILNWRKEGVAEELDPLESSQDVDWFSDVGTAGPLADTEEYVVPRTAAIVALAMIAHAMADDLTATIHCRLDAPFHVYDYVFDDLFQDLELPPKMESRILAYADHAKHARILRTNTRFIHLGKILTSQGNKGSLDKLHGWILRGLTEETPWLAVTPSEVSHRRPILLQPFVWDTLLKANILLNRMDKAAEVWDDMIRVGSRPALSTWFHLIHFTGKVRGANRALASWQAMEASGVLPTVELYRSIILLLMEERRHDDAALKFAEFRAKDTVPRAFPEGDFIHIHVYNAMIKTHLYGSQHAEAQNLLADMRKHGPSPDISSYNAFLSYYYNTKDYRHLSSTLKAIMTDGLQGDVATFSIILRAYLQMRSRDEAIAATIRMMKKHGVLPNVAMYTSIIDNLLEERSEDGLRAAMDMVKMMEDHENPDVHPTVKTYTCILAGVYKYQELGPSLRQECVNYVLQKRAEGRVRWTKVAFHNVISAALSNRDPDCVRQALQYFYSMHREKVPTTQDTWYLLLRGLLDRGEVVAVSLSFHHLCPCSMSDVAPRRSRRRLVGQPLLYSISIFASLGVFLFGYDQGVMSGIITGPHFRKFFNSPGSVELGTMVAVLEIGAFITSLAAGRVGDIIGRRGTLFIGAIVFGIGGAIQTFTTGFSVMVVGRIISGFGVGLLSYARHFQAQCLRGALACMEFTCNVFGYCSSVWIDYFCSYIDSDLSWRIPLFIQCVIGAILAAGSLLMPESPRWLIDVDRDEEGMAVIADLHGGDPEDLMAKAEFQEIKDRVTFERESGEGRTYAAMWKKYKRRILLAMSSQAFAQLNGINVISYYAPSVFEEAGWLGRQAILMAGINAIIYLLSTIPTWYLVDRLGRRPILLSGAVVMGIALSATGWWMYIDVPATPQAVVVCVIIYNAFFGYSWGPLPWLYPPEILPLTVRAKGVSLSTATNWAFNFIVGEGTPYLQEVIAWRLYPMHGFFCACSFVLVYFLYPETKGVPLEEMDAVFGEDEREEAEENESERASLMSNTIPTNHQSISPSHVRNNAASSGWVSRIMGRTDGRASYEPIADGEE
ncbi:hypothetical protein EWM64_g6795 [Hericium alpestre]|uniref:Major facilitator superfamily (MFS) profile domain-containing protein n=1 Tax=Hericium alpestre TaxID=135208 RepID=A0A4Y9ZT29_9AGAM|nr:hypothetical protein EWM64_g6795 [Hericium alpestre]